MTLTGNLTQELGSFRCATADSDDDGIDFLSVFQSFKHVFDDWFATDFNERLFLGDLHAGSFSASHNKRNYAHATTANKTITQTIRVISFVAPNTSPVTPLKCLCAIATMTKLVIMAANTMKAPAQPSRGKATTKEINNCNDEDASCLCFHA